MPVLNESDQALVLSWYMRCLFESKYVLSSSSFSTQLTMHTPAAVTLLLAASVMVASAYDVVQIPLDYPRSSLEPAISKETMDLHYDKHHAAYTKNLKAALDALEGEGKVPDVLKLVRILLLFFSLICDVKCRTCLHTCYYCCYRDSLESILFFTTTLFTLTDP